MAHVVKCDICGEIYKNYGKGREVDATLNLWNVDPELDNCSDSRDICPKCTKKLLEFIYILEQGYTYTIYCEED